MAFNTPKKTIAGFRKGFSYPLSSISFVWRHPALWPYIIIPFILNLSLFSLVAYFGFGYFQELVASQIPNTEAWYWFFLNYLLLALGAIVVLVMIFFSFTVVGAVIASPFNDLLSERCEMLLTGGIKEELFSLSTFVADAKRTVINQLKMVGMFVAGMLLLFMLNILPGVGSAIYAVLSVMWVIFFLVVEYTGYHIARKRLLFKDHRRVIYDRFSLMAGFGCALFCMLAIPLSQLVMIPLGVVGGTRMLIDEEVLTTVDED